MIKLFIDIREHSLIEELKDRDVPMTVERLDMGDIIFRQEDDVLLIIERKTIEDLKASICDGRSREQKARLLGSGMSPSRIMYLVEGDLDKPLEETISGVPIGTLLGSIINTQLRDNIKVYKTNSLSESAEFIRKMLSKLEKDIKNYFNDAPIGYSAADYSATLKKQKKQNMTPEVWFIAQLSLIPQVAERVAEAIIKIYPCVGELMHAYEQIPEYQRANMLSDIPTLTTTGKMRRIGDKISLRIYQFFYGIKIDDE